MFTNDLRRTADRTIVHLIFVIEQSIEVVVFTTGVEIYEKYFWSGALCVCVWFHFFVVSIFEINTEIFFFFLSNNEELIRN